MVDVSSSNRNSRGDWRPDAPIALAPINVWPLRISNITKWFFGFPGFLWPYNAFWLAVTILTWSYLTPELKTMANLELWWIGLVLARNTALILILFGSLHLYLYVFKGQGEQH